VPVLDLDGFRALLAGELTQPEQETEEEAEEAEAGTEAEADSAE
jgi:hypothetical protein